MIQYLIEKYAMSEAGAQNLKQAIGSRTIVNVTKLFPPTVAFIFLFQYLGNLTGSETVYHLTPIHYIVMIAVMLVIMFIVARWDYVKLYTGVYGESATLRIDIANRLKKLPLSYFEQRDLVDVSETMMNDLSWYENAMAHAVPHIYATLFSTSFLSVMMLGYNFKLGLAALWVIPVSLLMFLLSQRKNKHRSDDWVRSNRAVLDGLQEMIDHIQDIKAYHLEEQSLDSFGAKLSINQKNKKLLEFMSGIAQALATMLLKLGIVTVAVLGAQMFIVGEINLLTYIAFLMLTTSIYQPIENILTYMAMLTTLDSVVVRIREIKTMPIQEGATEMSIVHHDIEFQNVHFGYDDYSVINGVSFTAKQGEVTALVGPSGSGKTTLAKLAARFWDINQGRILLGSVDISAIDPETLLQHFSIVFQDVILFNGSIKDNIKIGKKDASDAEVVLAAKIARCDEFIERLPDGIDTLIGENGVKLSGGERQRLSIARAILKDAPIILLDEATASLDVHNETLIQEALSELVKDKTVIIIAHRLRTIRNADQIVLLNYGRVEAVGTDVELSRNCESYQTMLELSKAHSM